MSNTSENSMPGFREMVGSGFMFGAALRSFIEFTDGFRTSPKGHQRFISGVRSIHNNAPRIAELASLAGLCLGIFSATELAMRHSRQKDDKWNRLTAGTFTSMLFQYYYKRQLFPAVKSSLAFGSMLFLMDATVEKALSYYYTGARLESKNSTQATPVNASSPTD